MEEVARRQRRLHAVFVVQLTMSHNRWFFSGLVKQKAWHVLSVETA